jgi:hypothetical protein
MTKTAEHTPAAKAQASPAKKAKKEIINETHASDKQGWISKAGHKHLTKEEIGHCTGAIDTYDPKNPEASPEVHSEISLYKGKGKKTKGRHVVVEAHNGKYIVEVANRNAKYDKKCAERSIKILSKAQAFVQEKHGGTGEQKKPEMMLLLGANQALQNPDKIIHQLEKAHIVMQRMHAGDFKCLSCGCVVCVCA